MELEKFISGGVKRTAARGNGCPHPHRTLSFFFSFFFLCPEKNTRLERKEAHQRSPGRIRRKSIEMSNLKLDTMFVEGKRFSSRDNSPKSSSRSLAVAKRKPEEEEAKKKKENVLEFEDELYAENPFVEQGDPSMCVRERWGYVCSWMFICIYIYSETCLFVSLCFNADFGKCVDCIVG